MKNAMKDVEKGNQEDEKNKSKVEETRLIPNSPEYEEKFGLYWSGTCYEPVDILGKLGIEEPRDMPYLNHVKRLSKNWTNLQQLVEFMAIGTTPLQSPYFKDGEREERVSRTKVTFIEFRPEKKPHVTPITKHTELRETLNGLASETAIPPLRLFVVEDLSQQVIELLGARFDIDPLFFREQIEDNVWHNLRDTGAMPPSLTCSTRQRSWFRIRNMRLRYHKTDASFQAAKLEATAWNVSRRPDNDNNHWAHKDEVERDGSGKVVNKAVVSILRTRTNIWIGKDKKSEDGTVGIILLDPTLKAGNPLWHDRTNWLPTTGMDEDSPPLPASNKTWHSDIVAMTSAYPWFEIESGHTIGSQVLAVPTLYTICAEWLIVCDYVRTRLSQIEWEIEIPDVFRDKEKDDVRSKSQIIADSLKRLHTWRRHIPVFRDMVTEALQQALPAAERLISPSSTTEDAARIFDDIKPDFNRILDNLKELQDRVDRLTEIVTSEINIEDSNQSREDNHNLTRLTWLATTFIPMSFISAFFSMNESVAELKYTYGWFFLTAIPFTAICLFIARLVGGGKLGKHVMKKNFETKGKSLYNKYFKLE
ncbi:hypothetical protein OPT61_g961 [Boeremia exigua]|uniref:Uncharacterized protein n=1 Tax=Boeremia exigua TaxID=749465 RepID=A0ACC2IRW7_9PLEO|nr:hypothetical protein OPT61_g961 [Boeremia exigua]